MHTRRRVVVTGIGVVTSIGVGVEAFWRALLAGQSGIGPVESFDTSRYAVHLGGEVKSFDGRPYLHRLSFDSMARASHMAIAATRLALEDARFSAEQLDPGATGVSMGTTSGEPSIIERFNDLEMSGGRDRIGAEFVEQYPSHVIAAHVASEFGFSGPNLVIPTACAAGNYALAHALDTLRSGAVEVMIAGGSDSFSRITYTGFARLGAIAPDRCQPFDLHRKGMIPGEGSAVLVLELLERAAARNAPIYAELAGYALTCDAYHMTAPQGDGATRAMTLAMADAGVEPSEVGYISAHGTGTAVNDRIETLAVKNAFGDAAYHVPISSIKSMLGHTMGAASAIEAAVCALAVRDDAVPPTIHYESRDPECDLDYVPNVSRRQRVDVAMNNAYAFGGNNASVIFRKRQA
jgi:3-oxoacyl-[acyl-carrier-protein] synthase II